MTKCIFFSILLCTLMLTAQVRTVYNNAHDDGITPGTLRTEISQAQDGDVIVFKLEPKAKIELSQEMIKIDKDITIKGSGAENLTICRKIDAQKEERIFLIYESKVEISGITFSHGWARFGEFGHILSSHGGAIYNYKGELSLLNCIFTKNKADGNGGSGGAIYNEGQLSMDNCSITENISFWGGGVRNGVKGQLKMINCTIAKNNASGIVNHGELTMINCTVSDNIGRQGAGIYNEGQLTLSNCTVAHNICHQQGSGIWSVIEEAKIQLDNTIVAKNYGAADLWGNFSSGGFNLVGNQGFSIFDKNIGDQIGDFSRIIDPMLASLQNNGGFTPTIALLKNSPAIDTGNPLSKNSKDQRGAFRLKNADIGSFEFYPDTQLTE